MRILIGTPTYDWQVLTPYHMAVLGLVERFRDTRPAVRFKTMCPATALVSWARNALATIMLEERAYSHLLFIDADTGFRPELVEKMIDFGEPVVGCVYPKRGYDFARLEHFAGKTPDWRDVAQPYVGSGDALVRDHSGRVNLRDGFAQATLAGTGMMLIQREALEQLSARYPELWAAHPHYAALGVTGRAFQVFEPWRNDEGAFLSEDYSFCNRWVQGCGGEIWSCVTERIVHVGREQFAGVYEKRLRHEGLL